MVKEEKKAKKGGRRGEYILDILLKLCRESSEIFPKRRTVSKRLN